MCFSCCRSLSVCLLLSDFAPFHSNQWHEPFTHSLEWRPVAAQRLQQRALLFFLLVSGESTAAPCLRRQAAQQAETVPHYLAAVWQRHFARDRRASPHPRPRPGGKPAERGPTWGKGAGGGDSRHRLRSRSPFVPHTPGLACKPANSVGTGVSGLHYVLTPSVISFTVWLWLYSFIVILAIIVYVHKI